MLKKNYTLNYNRQKNSKSQTIKHNNIPKYKKSMHSPSKTKERGKTSHWGGVELKKYKSTNKTISVNSLPKIDSYFISNSFVPNTNTNTNRGPFELFVRNKTSYFKNSDLKEENINDEEFVEIELLWDELGVTDEYQDQFEMYLNSINNLENKKNFLYIEKNNLYKIKEALIKFSKEKINRIKNIGILKKLNNNIKENKTIGDNIVNKELLKEIVEVIKAIRINSVNVVNNLIKVRETMTCFSLEDKINFDKINKDYLFDNNYLLKMNSELSFLKYSEIDKLFNKSDTDENLDTFLTIYNNIYKNEKEKNNNMITKELINAINKCRYYMMEDNFLNNIKIKKILKINNKSKGQKLNNNYKGNSLMTLSNMGFRDFVNDNMDNKLYKLKNELGKNYNNIFLNAKKKNINFSFPNNKRYNFLKNQIKNNNNNIVIEREESPYKINNDNLDLNYKNNNKNLENIKKKYEFKNEDEKFDNNDDNHENLKNENSDDNKDYNENINEKLNLNVDSKNNNNKKIIKYKEEEIINNNNDLDGNNEIDNKKNNENETKNKNEEITKEKEKEEEKNKDIEKKKDDEEDKIIDMDYLDDIKEK